MKWLDAAQRVLEESATPLGYRELADQIVRRKLVETQTRTPAISPHVSVSSDIRRRRDRGVRPRFTLSRGEIGLAEWEIGPLREALATIEKTRDKAKRDLLAKLRKLDGAQFEGFLEVLFTRMGYDVQVVGGTGDQGIDLVAESDSGIGGQRLGIQAKCVGPSRLIGPTPVRVLRDALTSRGCNAGAVVGTAEFNPDAQTVAAEAGRPTVQLIGPDRLADLALEYKVGIRSESLEAYQEDLGSLFEPQLVDDV